MIRTPREILIRLDHPRFVAFLRHLYIDEDYAPEDIFRVIESPWKWDEEFREFVKTTEAQYDSEAISSGT